MIKARIRQVIQKYNDNKNSAKRLLKWTGIAVGILTNSLCVYVTGHFISSSNHRHINFS